MNSTCIYYNSGETLFLISLDLLKAEILDDEIDYQYPYVCRRSHKQHKVCIYMTGGVHRSDSDLLQFYVEGNTHTEENKVSGYDSKKKYTKFIFFLGLRASLCMRFLSFCSPISPCETIIIFFYTHVINR